MIKRKECVERGGDVSRVSLPYWSVFATSILRVRDAMYRARVAYSITANFRPGIP